MTLSEKEKWVFDLKMGSYKAFEALYSEYFDLLYGYIFGMVRSHTQSKEIVQDTFIKVWLHRSKINTELSYKAWLFKIAKNQLLNEIKKNFSDPVFEDYLVHCENNDLAVQADIEFDLELFRIALVKAKQKLSPRQTQVFEMCKEEGLSATEVAQKLNITEDSVYNYLSQSLALLRKEMKELSFMFFIVFMLL
ncbi:MAG: sigma-70 family RNA polymerase sigma factor [Paludibacter sp.]|nr:sigma-70 family RNA polymerase sigma factor [Paludibacter sp.]